MLFEYAQDVSQEICAVCVKIFITRRKVKFCYLMENEAEGSWNNLKFGVFLFRLKVFEVIDQMFISKGDILMHSL
jgi:hypothetical protein